MKRILVLDNYDSFTYNLVQYIEEITDRKVKVVRNDEIELDMINQYDIVFLSPGPGLPKDAGIMKQLIEVYGPKKHIFGICLGHQAIAEVYGAKLINMKTVFHGIATMIRVLKRDDPLFRNVSYEFMGGRYHSWIVDRESIPSCLEITAVDQENQIMAIRHKKYKVVGVQFHPESVLTPDGKQMLIDFLNE